MGKPRDFKFGTLIDLVYHSKSQPVDEKSSLKGAWSGSGDLFKNFTRASAHKGKWGQLTPLEKWTKN